LAANVTKSQLAAAMTLMFTLTGSLPPEKRTQARECRGKNRTQKRESAKTAGFSKIPV
jgi:hypothetical protein